MQGMWSTGTVAIPNVTGNIVITVETTAVTISSISAIYNQSGTVFITDSLDSLKDDLTVTATWSDSSTTIVSSSEYTLSGTLAEGSNTITVSYGGQTATFTVIAKKMGYDDYVDTTIPTTGQHILTASDFTSTSDYTTGGVTYIRLYGYNANYTNVIMPATMNGKTTMTQVASSSPSSGNTSFAGNTTIQYVTFEDNCVFGDGGQPNNSGAGAFYGCTNLIGVSNVPTAVNTLSRAFYGCTNLSFIDNLDDLVNVTSLYMAFQESGVEYIQDLSSWTALASIQACFKQSKLIRPFGFPELASSVAGTNFYANCSYLEYAIVPEGVNGLLYGFYSDSALRQVDIYADSIPSSGIESTTFSGCNNLTVYCHHNTTTEASLISAYGSSTKVTILNFDD